MTSRVASIAFVAVVVCLLPRSASAHRVDEYLQATRISVERGRVVLDMTLTPGIEVAPLVFSWIDANHDGRISSKEGAAYAGHVLHSLELSVDGHPVALAAAAHEFPAFREMSLGVGAIRLRAAAKLPWMSAGDHRVVYRNTHRPEWSVYLANALVPDDNRVQIVEQQRDRAQRELTIHYRLL